MANLPVPLLPPAAPCPLPLGNGLVRPNPDGSVTLTLEQPFTMRIRRAGGALDDWRCGALVFHPLQGQHLRPILREIDDLARASLALAGFLRLKPAIIRALPGYMAPADLCRMEAVFAFCLLASGVGKETAAYKAAIKSAWNASFALVEDA